MNIPQIHLLLWALREGTTIEDVAKAVESKQEEIIPQVVEISQEEIELKVDENGQIRLF